jgi:cation diffusion facilitator family transporter
MHQHDITTWQHSHDFSTGAEQIAEQRTRWVVYLTLTTMIVELAAGWLTGSMALLADGWHMGSHAAALGLSVLAYGFARRHARDPRFCFGTGKVSPLAGYSSALLLGAGALWLFWESVSRLLHPVQIQYGEAIAVALLGLGVNLLSAWLLGGAHAQHHGHDRPAHDQGGQYGHEHDNDNDNDNDNDHEHEHDHRDGHGHAGSGHAHKDHNLRAAYVHVIADALTSLLAIGALTAGLIVGWRFLDPLMGIAGGLLIGRWSWSLARDSALTLLDAEDHGPIEAAIRRTMARQDDVDVSDLHVWRIGAASHACILSLVTHEPRPVEFYKGLLEHIPGIGHLTVEVQQCRAPDCGRAAARSAG